MLKSYGYIYKTINILNNKVYIGKHKGEFSPDYYGSGIYLNKAINKHGKDKFKLEVVIYAEDENKLNELEKHYIQEYRKQFGKRGLYNIANGGDGGIFMPGDLNPSKRPEVRKKISEANKGRIPSTEHRIKTGKNSSGRVWINKNSKTKFIKENELQHFTDLGWKIGRPISWDFKQPFISQETKDKIKATLKKRVEQGNWFNQYTERR